jgi:hypothetical protein
VVVHCYDSCVFYEEGGHGFCQISALLQFENLRSTAELSDNL